LEITVPYGPDRRLAVAVPARNLLAVVEPRGFAEAVGPDIIRWALREPVNAYPFKDFAKNRREILVIVNDASRPTPTAQILGVIFETIPDRSAFRFLIATGIHRTPTPTEMEYIFGEYYGDLKGRVYAHDAEDEGKARLLGKTRRGTEVRLNELAVQARTIIAISSVEPHYFAGFTGGRKSFLPGIAARLSVEANHRLTLDPRARLLALRGNPVHEDMAESLKFLADKEIFSIQTVLDRNRDIFACAAGQIRDSFYRAVKYARKVYCRPVPGKADIVLTIASYPMDIDLYQSQKAIENAKPALKKGGILILVSRCRTGIGDRAFYDRLAAVKNPSEVLGLVDHEYRLGYHKSIKLAELMIQAEVWAVTDLPDRDLEKIFIRPFSDPQAALDAALKKKGPKAKVLVLMDGSVTVPIVRD
jgi:nickel-dependent lactate racemase